MNNVYTTISFPGLGLEWNPPRAIDLGPLSLRFYALIITCGLLLAVWYAYRRCHQFGIQPDDLLDGVLWVVPVAIICTRAYYCIFSWDQFADNPISVLYIWEGGLAIYGGVLGAAAGIAVFAKVKKISLPALLDLVSLGFLIGQSIGRWGNFFNREAFGAATDSFLRMGLLNSQTGQVEYYHPTFLYESVWNLAGFVLLHFLSKRRKYDGQIALGYVAWYGFGRAIIEGLRTDSLYWGSFRVSQVLAAVSCFAAVVTLVVLSFRPHKPLYAQRVAQASPAEEPAPEAPVEESIPEEPAPEAPEESSPESPEDDAG